MTVRYVHIAGSVERAVTATIDLRRLCMTNLTDPQLASLVARYRAWVAEQQISINKHYEENRKAALDRYYASVDAYNNLSWWRKRRAYRPAYPSWVDWGNKNQIEMNWERFQNWCLREGIEDPKGGV